MLNSIRSHFLRYVRKYYKIYNYLPVAVVRGRDRMVVGFSTTYAISAISPLTLWVRIPFMARCTQYNIMWWSLGVNCDRSVVFSGYSFPPPKNWYIFESGVKHQNPPNPPFSCQLLQLKDHNYRNLNQFNFTDNIIEIQHNEYLEWKSCISLLN